MTAETRLQIHATTLLLGQAGVALTGPSGSGKSDLALRLIDGGAQLVADDRTDLSLGLDGGLVAAPPPVLAGLLEMRGYGIVALPWVPAVRLRLVVLLAGQAQIPRMPEPETRVYLGVTVPLIRLCAWEASAPARLRLIVGQLAQHGGGAG